MILTVLVLGRDITEQRIWNAMIKDTPKTGETEESCILPAWPLGAPVSPVFGVIEGYSGMR